jgi:hypothetical protein
MSGMPSYVSQGSFDVDPQVWAKAKDEVRLILVERAKRRQMIPYSELVGLVGSVQFTPHDQRLFALLGQVSVEESEQGRPLLSVLVVHKTGDMKPGPGFFEMAKALGRDTKDADKAWIVETQKVFQYWNK